MIREIRIENIRGIREGKLDKLTRIVVLVGPNNVGKSTILEALWLGATANPQDILGAISMRRPGVGNSIRWLLFRENGVRSKSGVITIKSDALQLRITTLTHQSIDENANLEASTTFKPEPKSVSPIGTVLRPALADVPAIRMVEPRRTTQSLADLFGDVAKRGLKESVRSIVAELLPDVTDIAIYLEQQHMQQVPTVFFDYKTGAKPVALAGDGVQHLLLQCLELASPTGGTVLLEEPEAHLHPKAIRQSARAIIAAASRGIQVVLTTHSLDLIDMLLAEIKPENIDDLSFYRLQLQGGKLTSSRFSGSEAAFSRGQIEEDLR